MKKLLLLIVLTFSGTLSYSRETIRFDDGWKFHLGHATDNSKDFNYRSSRLYGKTAENYGTCIHPGFDDSGWEDIRLPHDWAVELPFEHTEKGEGWSHGYKTLGAFYPECSVGWYRKTFTMPDYSPDDRISLTFDGVFRDCQVWVNNFYLGRNFSGYTSFSYDITDFIHPGKDNIVVVRVDASQVEGWFYEGAGIYRHVWLNICDNVHFEDNGIFITSHLNSDRTNAEIKVKADVESWRAEDINVQISAVVKDREDNAVTRPKVRKLKIDADGKCSTEIEMSVENPMLWDIESPYLYRMETTLLENGKELDKRTTIFGIREIIFDKDKGLFLNGRNIKIQGVCCHQDHAGVGSALPDFLQYYRVGLLKEMGANAYRCSHNPPTPELLDACDSLGLLVIDETRLTNSGQEYMGQWESMLLRDRNHPCIFMWSVGNEEERLQSDEKGRRIASSMIRCLRQLDPTRPATYGANNGDETEGINEVIDIRGFNYNIAGIDRYRKARPDQPIYGSEVASTVTTRGVYEADSVRNYLTDFDENYPPWGSSAQTWWKMAAEREWFMGGFVWTGFDYRGEPTPHGWPNISSHFGIMDVCGFPKNVYWYYRSWWTDDDIINIAPHWNHPGCEGDTVKVWVNTNAEEVSLYLNDRHLGCRTMPRNGHLVWHVPYEAGCLRAVAHKAGYTFEKAIYTTGPAVSLSLSPHKEEIPADGSEGIVINVEAIDRNGRHVPDAQHLIRFRLEGDARIIGVGNGDPSCHEPDKCKDGEWERSLFNGRCQVIVEGGTTAGDIIISASSEGLDGTSVTIRQK